MKPTPGRIVLYKLSGGDARAINVRRADFRAFEAGHEHPHKRGQPAATGHIAHVGNQATEGDVYPATVVRVWDAAAPSVNLQVHLDGNDTFWATSRHEGDEPGTWAWPQREPADSSPQVHVSADLSPQQVKRVAEMVQTELLQQARRGRSTAIKPPGRD